MSTKISARFQDGKTILVSSPFLTAVLQCVNAAYAGASAVEVGHGSGYDPSASDFLTFILAYPPDVSTPIVTVSGPLAPVGVHAPPPAAGRDVVLASGGIDSTAALLHMIDQGKHPLALWCDYGQPYAVPERAAVQDVCTELGTELIVVEMDLGTHIANDVRFGHVIPGRNLLIAGCAAALGAKRVVLAGLADELVVPDKSLRMYSEAHRYLGIPVTSPFVRMTKTDVLRVWAQQWREKLDARRTVSCYNKESDCQDCPACAKRAVAFVASGYAVGPFPVFERQKRLITESWLPRLPALPRVRRADLLIALTDAEAHIPVEITRALRNIPVDFWMEAERRRRELLARRDVN